MQKIVTEHKSATKAYAEVYDVEPNVASANATRLLGNASVQNALQQALRNKGIDEGSIADELAKIRRSWDWKAKESFVKLSSKILGYDREQSGPVAQVGNIINNWKISK